MMLKIAYLGEKFHGFARQPDLRTVEGDLLKALEKIGSKTKVYAASRTDRGVSAFSNVVRIECFKDNICRMLTALLDDIWVYGYSMEDWNPRHCTKHYTYFLFGTYDTDRMERCCTLFSGVHDFSALSRVQKNAIKEIAISFEVKDGVTLLHFAGRSFLWEMIRRCVTGMTEYLMKKRTEEEIKTILRGRTTVKTPPAPPENLLLARIVCENRGFKVPFSTDQFSAEKMQKEFHSRYRFHSMKKAMFEELLALGKQ
jgi:tRNA pseudouridine38-40 synthase